MEFLDFLGLAGPEVLPVRLVQNQIGDATEADDAPLHEVVEATRRGNDDLHACNKGCTRLVGSAYSFK